jgi:hypothetical protein
MAAAAAEPTTPNTGIVRGTLNYAGEVAQGVYTQAEQYAVVKTAIEYSKPLVNAAEPVVHRVVAAADPWVDSVDHVVTGAVQSVNARVIEPARDAEGHITVSGVYTSVKQVTTEELRHGYDVVVGPSDRAVDALLPDSEKAEIEKKEQELAHSKSLLEVTLKAQKRAMRIVEHHWKDARALSAGRLKEIIQVDLIETAANGYTLSLALVQNNVTPVVNDVSAKGAAVVNEASTRGAALAASAQSAFVSVREVSAEKSKLLWDSIREQSHSAYKFASDKAEEYGVPEIVGKAKEVSLGEVSEFVLVTLKIKEQNEHFVIAQNKLYDLFRTVIGVNLAIEVSSKPESTPAPKTE